MKLDAAYWNSRYHASQTAWDLGRVSSPIRHIVDDLVDKEQRILIPGAGYGHEAVYLYEQGFKDVTVLDYACEPIEILASKNLDKGRIKLVQQNFFDHQGEYDLILEQTFFCALELRFRESYPNKIHQLLSNKGQLKGIFFSFPDQRDEPPYTGTAEEYKKLFEPYITIKILEPCTFSEPSRSGKELFIELEKR